MTMSPTQIGWWASARPRVRIQHPQKQKRSARPPPKNALEKIIIKGDAGNFKSYFPAAWGADRSLYGQPVVQLQHSHGARAAPFLFAGNDAAGWHRDDETGWTWTGSAVVRVGVNRYLADAEGYHTLAAVHLQSFSGPASLEHVTVEPNGTVTMWVNAAELEDPQETMKSIAAGRKKGLQHFYDTVPSRQFARLINGDGLMHPKYVRHTDPFRQATPESFGLRTMPAMSAASAQTLFRQMVSVACENKPDRAEPGTMVAVALAAHAGQWSVESFDDRELSYMLGEDCDDMLIRARGLLNALKMHLPHLRTVRCGPQQQLATDMLDFIECHRILNCQGRACPPHPLETPGQIIGHVYGLFVRDCNLQSELGLKNGKPAYTTARALRALLRPGIMEATAASRSYPAPHGVTFEPFDGVESFRNEAYQSIDQCLEDDHVLYFFTVNGDPSQNRLASGIDPNMLVRPYGVDDKDDVDCPPDANVCILMMRAPDEFRVATDAVQVYHEPDVHDLQRCWEPFYLRHADAVHEAKHTAPAASMDPAHKAGPGAAKWRTSSLVASGASFSQLRY